MTGFDYRRLRDGPEAPSLTPSKPAEEPNPFLSIFSKLDLPSLVTKRAEPETPPLVSEDPYRSFIHYAVTTKLADAKYCQELADKLSGDTELLELLNGILARRSSDFSSMSEFYGFLAYDRSPNTSIRQRVIAAASSIQEAWIFDQLFCVISRDNQAKHDVLSNPEKAIPDIAANLVRLKPHLGPNQFFGGFKYQEVLVVLDHSKEPKHDINLVLESTLGGSPTPDQIRRYYQTGHHYIAHQEVLGVESWRREPAIAPEEADLRERFSRATHYPALHHTDKLVADLLSISLPQRNIVVDVMDSFYRDTLDFSYFAPFVELMRHKGDSGELRDLAKLIPNYSGDQLILALAVFEDIAHEDAQSPLAYIDDFRAGNLSGLEQKLYQHRLQQHQIKFPERPIEEVLTAFRTKEFPESEIPSEAALDRAESLYQRIYLAGETLLQDSKPELARKLQRLISEAEHCEPDEYKVRFFSLAREFFKREFGVYPYNTQMLAVLLMSDEYVTEEADKRGIYAQVKTGEGKSLIMCLLGAYQASRHQTVEIITSNEYLAKRDALRFTQFYRALGLGCSHLDKQNYAEAKKSEPSVLYTTNEALIFALLACRLSGEKFFDDKRQRVALVDESDNLCIDRTSEEMRIASSITPRFSKESLEQMRRFVLMQGASVIREDLEAAIASFQEANEQARSISPLMVALYLHSALHAETLVENENYVIDPKGKVIVVDVDNTGRLQHKLYWSHGLHEFVALKHGLSLPPAVGTTASMGHPTYLRSYKRLFCISGTVGDSADREELQEVYNLVGFDVPPHRLSKRVDYSASVYRTDQQWLSYIERTVAELSEASAPRPVLVVTGSVRESLLVFEHLKARGMTPQLLNDHLNRGSDGAALDENEIINRAGRAGMITVATSVAGRGADIIPDSSAIKAGGLHTLVTFLPINKRVEYQARGRSGRQGNAGSSEIVASTERDRFFRDLPEVAREAISAILTIHGPNSEELQSLIEFTRSASNALQSLQRRIRLEKDAVAQQGLELYYQAVSKLSGDLNGANKTFKMNPGISSFVVSLYLQESWGAAYDEFDTVLTTDGRLIMSYSQNGGNKIQESNSLQRVFDAFKRSFGISLQQGAILPADSTLHHAYLVAETFLRHAIALDSRRFTLNVERVAEMLGGLEQQVAKMTQDCFSRFEDANQWDIKAYIDQELKKRKIDRELAGEGGAES